MLVNEFILKELYEITRKNHDKYKDDKGKPGYPVGVVLFSDDEPNTVIWSGMNQPYSRKSGIETEKHAEQIAIKASETWSSRNHVTSMLVSTPPCEDCAPLIKEFPNLKNIYYITGNPNKVPLSQKQGFTIKKVEIPNDNTMKNKQMSFYATYIIKRISGAEKNKAMKPIKKQTNIR